MAEDVFFKKLISYRYCNQELRFRVSQDLFSSFKIDTGTQFLIRTVIRGCSHIYKKILDIGCGYGPIGLTLKALNPDCLVHMIDPDALAVAYSRRNAEINRLTDVKIYGSLDYDAVTENDFDLIISNIPGKAGIPVISHIIEDAFHYLSLEGIVAVVVVSPLEPVVAGIINNNKNIRLLDCKTRPGHTVFQYAFNTHHDAARHPEPNIDGRDVYYRGSAEFTAGGFTYNMATAYGLPEFDQLSYGTELLLDGLKSLRQKTFKNITVYNPQVGHIPVILWKMFQPEKLFLSSRDLLSLRYSAGNLELNGFPGANLEMSHQPGLEPGSLKKADLITGIIREDEGPEAILSTVRQMEDLVDIKGTILLSAGSTAITRIIQKLPQFPSLVMKERKKYRGYSFLVLQKQAK
jgi:16S rRNA (guanine1207-N2)-methyltransferase